MSILRPLYLQITKGRFCKPFHPCSISQKPSHLISAPRNARDFLKTFSFLAGLRNTGTLVILMPKSLEPIYGFMKHNIFKAIFYEKPLLLFSKEHKMLKKQLEHKRFNYLIELNVPANISLPYLISAEKRICLCEKNNFPYYNILIRNGFNTLNKFFEIKDSNPQDLFRFNTNSLRKIKRRFSKKRPLLFVNKHDEVQWEGHKVTANRDLQASDVEAFEVLYLSDAYCGEHDALYEFAKIFDKEIITPTNENKT